MHEPETAKNVVPYSSIECASNNMNAADVTTNRATHSRETKSFQLMPQQMVFDSGELMPIARWNF